MLNTYEQKTNLKNELLFKPFLNSLADQIGLKYYHMFLIFVILPFVFNVFTIGLLAATKTFLFVISISYAARFLYVLHYQKDHQTNVGAWTIGLLAPLILLTIQLV